MGKFNLSEAAAEILASSVNSKKAMQDKPAKLSGDVAYGTKEEGDIGTEVTKTTDSAPNATKGVPTAKAPGATPPVGAEPMKKLSSQPSEKGSVESPEGKPGRQMMSMNKGATFQAYEEEERDENLVEEKEDEGHEDEKEDKAMMKKMVKKNMKEDIDALLEGENLSEEFVNKATTIFEAAVLSRVETIVEQIQEEMQEQFAQSLEQIKEDFATKIDDYLNYMVEEWMKENELAVESGLRSEIVEDFIEGMRDLFAEHYIDIPEEKVDVVQELASKVEELEEQLNEQINRSMEYKKAIQEQQKQMAIQAVCEGLTQTQAEKLKTLAENVEFTTEEEFATKLSTLKEAYAPATSVKPAEKTVLEEGLDIEETKDKVSYDPLVDAVAKSISKSIVK